jgi:hypothetical protein
VGFLIPDFWLGNRIAEGNSYRSGHDNHLLAGEAHLGVFALPPSAEFNHPLTLGCVVRGNRLESNAHLAVGGTDPYSPTCANPVVQEVVVEGNRVASSDVGLWLRRASAGVLLRNNVLQGVRQPLRDEVQELKAAEERRRRLLASREPLLSYDFEGMSAHGVPDGSGNGFAARVSGAVTEAEGRLGKGAGGPSSRRRIRRERPRPAMAEPARAIRAPARSTARAW